MYVFILSSKADREKRASFKTLWSVACGSKDVAVTRQSHTVAGTQIHVYALAGPSSTPNVDTIEARLKQSLHAIAGGARVNLTRLG